MLKKGSKGHLVKELQEQLNAIQGAGLKPDGIFGKKTEVAVKFFQKSHRMKTTGIVTIWLGQFINEKFKDIAKGYYHYKKQFVVFVDAGHGGIDKKGRYTTAPGKMYHHPTEELHHRGYFYEGVENRLAAELFCEQLSKAGIPYVRTYHPYRDTSLSDRVDIVQSYLDRGYYGYMHSFHSNAISTSHSKEKLDKTQGYILFTTRGLTKSDYIADIQLKNAAEVWGDWVWGMNKNATHRDWEANFKILRETDKKSYENLFGAFIEECGFFTSVHDAKKIIEVRRERAVIAAKTAIEVRDTLSLWQDAA